MFKSSRKFTFHLNVLTREAQFELLNTFCPPSVSPLLPRQTGTGRKKGNSSFAIPFSFRPIVFLTQTMFYYICSGGSIGNLHIVYSRCGVHVSNMENIITFFDVN